MLYCPKNISITDIWVNHGTSQCFMETICTSVLSLHLFIFATIQWRLYSKYATPLALNILPKSKLYFAQLFFTYALSLFAIIKFLVDTFVMNNGVVYGYMILSVVLNVIMFPYSAYIISLERHYILPSIPARGHGVVLLIFWTLLFSFENLTFINLKRDDWWFHLDTSSAKIQMWIFMGRYISCLFLFIIGLRAPGIMTSRDYFNLSNNTSSSNREEREQFIASGSAWENVWSKVRLLAPFMWPKKRYDLQIRTFLCILLLAAARVANLFTPICSKLIVDSVSIAPISFRWDYVLLFVLLKFLQGGGTGSMGLLNNLRSFIWIRVQQYTTREVKMELFRHLHNLSLRWHLSRKTGEVLRVMDRGTDSIDTLLSIVLFQIMPTFCDIIIAITYFIFVFNLWFGLIVFVTMTFYIACTITITEWRTKFQRRMNLADNKAKAQSVDSILNFETVKYYGAEKYETELYREAVIKYQDEEWKTYVTLNILNSIQNVIICMGLLGGSLLCLHMVAIEHTLTVGDYVLFASYITQLYVPLNWFGTFYRQIQNNLVNMENMFDLLSEEIEVRDSIDAPPIQVTRGLVEFRKVTFSYVPERTVLKNVTFTVHPGKTVALVGPSGSGKTTIIRLLFRLYDVDDGLICIDGQNIKMVKQSSLRKAIGVVPQDTVLFNNTIKYNIQYGRVDAPEADVIAAAKSADIHERILSFPDLYNTQVGERGLKLSGGEKQRVAISRTILKSPTIVLLDEATSSLDTQTERNIQTALSKVCANRTTIIVAHRLSTIIHADEILVLKDGEICERGRHEELINENGLYHTMWEQQLKNEELVVDDETTQEIVD